MADQPARHGHGRDHDVADRPSGGELEADLRELDHSHARGLSADAIVLTCADAGSDQITAVMLTRPGDELRDRGGTDPTAGRANRPAVRLRVERGLNQRQVRECIADLGALVQPAALTPVCDAPRSHPDTTASASDRLRETAGITNDQSRRLPIRDRPGLLLPRERRR